MFRERFLGPTGRKAARERGQMSFALDLGGPVADQLSQKRAKEPLRPTT
jgi:hypothetical protein